MIELITVIRNGDKVLFRTGLIHIVLAVLFLCLILIDSRMVNQENIWMKPFRFAVSIAMFTWTYAWFSRFYARKRVLSVLNITIAICMFLEIILITMQAVRGVASHFNTSSPFDTAVFSVMGGIIGFNAIIIGIHFVLFLFFENGGGTYRLSIIWGMVLFLLGNFTGYLMVHYFSALTMDAVVGQGMPITNWQPDAGDLRIAHFLGLHAIQFMPFTGFLLERYRMSHSVIHFAGLLYLIILAIAMIYPGYMID
jgi:hypothetical protein